MSGGGGRFYWVRNRVGEFKAKGIVVAFVWISISDTQLKGFIDLCFSLGWNCLVCRSDFLNPFIPERATALGFSILREIIKELRCGLCPVVLASFSGGSKACMYKVLQIIDGCSEVELHQDEGRVVASCISGQIYDSDPIDFSTDLGARLGIHLPIFKVPGSSKLVSLFAKGVTSSLDALFITNFQSQQQEYWQTLYSSVSLGAPFLVLCSEKDDVAACSEFRNFSQHLQDFGGNAKYVKYGASGNDGHHTHQSINYATVLTEMLEQSISTFCGKIQQLQEKAHIYDMHDEISYLTCDLQNAAVDSNQSFRRVAAGPSDHFFLPSSSAYQKDRESSCLNDEQRERSPPRSTPSMNANSVLGHILFDACVPKNVEGWDIKFLGSVKGEPFPSVRKRSSPFRSIKHRSRL